MLLSLSMTAWCSSTDINYSRLAREKNAYQAGLLRLTNLQVAQVLYPRVASPHRDRPQAELHGYYNGLAHDKNAGVVPRAGLTLGWHVNSTLTDPCATCRDTLPLGAWKKTHSM